MAPLQAEINQLSRQFWVTKAQVKANKYDLSGEHPDFVGALALANAARQRSEPSMRLRAGFANGLAFRQEILASHR